MLGTLKKWGTDLTLKTKDLFTSPESQVYVKDLRKVMTYNGRKCQYPKNYDQIVESGRIIEQKDSNGKLVKDEKGNPEYQLAYNGHVFNLTLVKEIDNRSYFTIEFLVSKDRREVSDYRRFYKPFKFSKIDLEKHLPVFEAQKTKGSQYPFKLTLSSVLTKKEKNEEGKIQEVVNEKGRNGELLYTSDYKKLNTSFSEVRDQNGNLELDKSLISVPIVFVTSLAKVCAKLLTFAPVKFGEYLIGKQNPIVKSLSYLLFTPAVAVKNLVNIGATLLKLPICAFVANKEKYGDAYWTMWKHQLKECWEEVKSDFNVIKGRERLKPEQKNHNPRSIVGTWKELDARRPGIEQDLEKKSSKSSESIDKSRKPGIEKSEEKLQNENNERIAGHKDRESNNTHVNTVLSERNSQREEGSTYTRSN
ncbi:hypothetical protein HET73_02080 [Wolbachia endosymbiont of Atemnus politus]|uniref:hypothetical protein n=1 Tax=Wolbachia endosymbiont of Atemnus politus TaxID=2682840 RepID=UPI0015744D1C|nr:hypothetical protein [Wolbachia endosymbiont of Atemnus politus]NSM56391.1 hypothetical protein [Wolbachia endosymbiont of Atemnus politus]NSX83273.1 hypothetical protein [Wolbachia endosymbiont of Atemnus politus]